MGAAVSFHGEQPAALRRGAAGTVRTIPVPVPSGVHPRLDAGRTRAAHVVACALAGQCLTTVAARAQVARPHVNEWADPASERLPNVGHLLAEGGAFARGVLTGALAEIEASQPVDPARVEHEALVLAARMGQVLVAIQSLHLALPPAQARALCREAAALAEQADRLRRVLAMLAREGR